MKIQLINQAGSADYFQYICQKWQLVHDNSANFALVLNADHLTLQQLDLPKQGAICVDFVQGTLAHRRKFGGGRGEAIAKAVGIKKDYLPTVLDATAGLGRDAFVLAAIGCKVYLLERNPVVAALLEDGLRRAYQDTEIGAFMQERMQLLPSLQITDLLNSESTELCSIQQAIDVVYLDPMYPHKPKSALVKKEMRAFQQLVGADLDADFLLSPALSIAKKRVVVKRPDYADFLAEKKPHFSHTTKNHRFDIYLTNNITV